MISIATLHFNNFKSSLVQNYHTDNTVIEIAISLFSFSWLGLKPLWNWNLLLTVWIFFQKSNSFVSASRGRWGHIFGSGNLTELPSAEFTIALGNYKQKVYLEDNFFPKKAEIIADFFISSFSADILFDLLPQTSHLLKNNYFSWSDRHTLSFLYRKNIPYFVTKPPF